MPKPDLVKKNQGFLHLIKHGGRWIGYILKLPLSVNEYVTVYVCMVFFNGLASNPSSIPTSHPVSLDCLHIMDGWMEGR